MYKLDRQADFCIDNMIRTVHNPDQSIEIDYQCHYLYEYKQRNKKSQLLFSFLKFSGKTYLDFTNLYRNTKRPMILLQGNKIIGLLFYMSIRVH